jgi:hypothetical protein
MEHRIRDTKKAKVYLINFNFENWNVSNDTSNLSLKDIVYFSDYLMVKPNFIFTKN